MQIPYAGSSDYKNTYKGTIIPDAELDSYLLKASSAVDRLTYGRIIAGGHTFTDLTPFQQMAVILAVCCQADHMYQYGDTPASIQSYNVGGNTVNMGANIDMRYSRQAIDYLGDTGLRYRGMS